MSAPGAANDTPLVEVSDLRKHFARRRALFGPPPEPVRAVDGVSFTIRAGEWVGGALALAGLAIAVGAERLLSRRGTRALPVAGQER